MGDGKDDTSAFLNSENRIIVGEGVTRLNDAAEGKPTMNDVPGQEGWLEYNYEGETTDLGVEPGYEGEEIDWNMIEGY